MIGEEPLGDGRHRLAELVGVGTDAGAGAGADRASERKRPAAFASITGRTRARGDAGVGLDRCPRAPRSPGTGVPKMRPHS